MIETVRERGQRARKRERERREKARANPTDPLTETHPVVSLANTLLQPSISVKRSRIAACVSSEKGGKQRSEQERERERERRNFWRAFFIITPL